MYQSTRFNKWYHFTNNALKKKWMFSWKKCYDKLSVLKSKDIPLETKVHKVKAMVFPCPSLSAGVCSNSRPSNQWCYLFHPLLPTLLLLPSIFPSIRIFSNESALCIRWPKYCSFSISLSNEYSGLISFRINWFYLFAGQGTLKSLLQDHNLKASILQRSAFFMFQLSVHDYWKNHSFDYVDLCWQSDVSAF